MLIDQPPAVTPLEEQPPAETPISNPAWTCELEGGFDDSFDDFDEEDFDDEFDDDFEEEVEGEYELQDDEYGAEFNESTADRPKFGDFDDGKKKEKPDAPAPDEKDES